MAGSCSQCGNKFTQKAWYCSHCGCGKSSCPECGASIGSKAEACSSCGAVRQQACEECESLIDADNTQCPECGYDAKEAKARSGKKRLAISGGIILVSFFVMSSISGALPSFLSIIGQIVALPGFLIGAYVGYQGISKINASNVTASDHMKTVSLFQDEEYGFFDSLQNTAESEGQGTGEPEHVRRERKRKKQIRKKRREHDLPSACPSCNSSWTEGGFEIYDDGNRVRCRECGHSEMLFG
jgi:hypothetical protein